MITKEEIQRRVLKNGKPLELDKFTWCEKTNTFSTTEDGLVLDFSDLSNCFIYIRNSNTITAGDSNTITAGYYNTITAEYNNTIRAGSSNTIRAGSSNTITAGNSNTITVGEKCVYIRIDIFEVIMLEEGKKYQIAPYNIKGYLKDGIYSETGKKSVIIDGILSEVIKEKHNILHVKNHGEGKISYIVKDGDVYSHGATLEEAKKSLKYKISNRDTTQYKDYTLDTKLSLTDLIRCYRVITGACEGGAKYFIEQNKIEDREYVIKEFIDITKGQYGNETFAKFFSK
jgi:hypothetical protein